MSEVKLFQVTYLQEGAFHHVEQYAITAQEAVDAVRRERTNCGIIAVYELIDNWF